MPDISMILCLCELFQITADEGGLWQNFTFATAPFLCLSPHRNRHADQHIFEEDPIAGGGIIDQHMGDGAHQLSVLNDGGT